MIYLLFAEERVWPHFGHLSCIDGSTAAPHFSHLDFDSFFFPVLNHEVKGPVMKIVIFVIVLRTLESFNLLLAFNTAVTARRMISSIVESI